MTLAPESKRYSVLGDVEWDTWAPTDRATLLFILDGDRVLLIRKQRGLGAGKINGPGGRLDPGETPLQAAVREVEEELCITPTGVRQCGELLFQFVDGYSLHGYVFTATGYEGEPRETDEAIPLWMPAAELPYDEMWADDRLWFPMLLAGTPFHGRFLFDGDAMLGHEIVPPSPVCLAVEGMA
jgi:8-oxo-dGTP diphosphatase